MQEAKGASRILTLSTRVRLGELFQCLSSLNNTRNVSELRRKLLCETQK